MKTQVHTDLNSNFKDVEYALGVEYGIEEETLNSEPVSSAVDFVMRDYVAPQALDRAIAELYPAVSKLAENKTIHGFTILSPIVKPIF